MRLLFDVETNGLLKQLDRIHILAIRDVTHPTERPTYVFRRNDTEDTIAEGVAMLMKADVLMGHNIIGFDLPTVQKVFPDFYLRAGVSIIDTLVLARMIAPDTKKNDAILAKRGKFPGYLVGSHSLDAWGWRLGKHKGDYQKEMRAKGIDPWSHWNQPMEDYCVNDIDVNEILLAAIETDMPPDSAITLETEIHDLTEVMSRNGVPFDHAAALTLKAQLENQLTALSEEVKKTYGFWYAPETKYTIKDPWPKPDGLSKKQKKSIAEAQKGKFRAPRIEWGEDSSRAVWADFKFPAKAPKWHAERIAEWKDECARRAEKGLKPKPRPVRLRPDKTDGCPFSPIVRKEFNPGSRDHIIDRFTLLHGWKPFEFTDTGRPTVDDEVLTKLAEDPDYVYAAPLADIFFHKKTLGQLDTGDNSWLAKYNPETKCIHGRINVGGTVSGRCSHSHPNLGQVPGVEVEPVVTKDGTIDVRFLMDGVLVPWAMNDDGTPKKKAPVRGRAGFYGWECRSLFGTHVLQDPDWQQLGVDLINIEGRCLGARLAPYDNGELVDALCYQGIDIHDFNMQKTGINNRGVIKRVFFGLIYGAGDAKLGYTAMGGLTHEQARKLGAEYRARIMQSIPALAKVTEQVQAEAKRGFLIGVDGRRLGVRHEHAALNLRLQSDAGLIAKKWLTLTEQNALKVGLSHGWTGDFVMMLFVHDEQQDAVRRRYAQQLADIAIASAREAGESFNYLAPVAADAKLGDNWAMCH